MARDEKPPEPGYAATLMGDDTASIMKPLLTVMTAVVALNAMQQMAPKIGMGMSVNSAMKGPSTNPFAGGPKLFG